MSDTLPSPAIREPARLQALRQTKLLDSEIEEAFDRFTRLAARVLNVPVALVSLVDEDRQFFKSALGLPEPWASRRQTPLSHSFCKHVVAMKTPLVVDDARQHALVCDNGAVADLGVIAYAGVPLTTSANQTLGALCVIESVPRCWTEGELNTLREIASAVVSEIEQRQARYDLTDSEKRFQAMLADAGGLASHDEPPVKSDNIAALLDDITEAVGSGALVSSRSSFQRFASATFDAMMLSESNVVCEVNPAFVSLFGYAADDAVGQPVDRFVVPEQRAELLAWHERGDDCDLPVRALCKDENVVLINMRSRAWMAGQRKLRVTALREHMAPEHAAQDASTERSLRHDLLELGRQHEVTARVSYALKNMFRKPLQNVLQRDSDTWVFTCVLEPWRPCL